MKGTHLVFMIAVLASATMFAQSTTGGTTDAHTQHHPGTAAPAQSGTSNQGSGMEMGGQSGMAGHMAAMQADMQQMRTQVEKMRADAEKVKDLDTRAVLLQNAALWQRFLDRMQSHMQMMSQGMMGMHGMMGQSGGGDAAASGGCQMMEGQTPPAKTNPPPKPQ